MLINLSDSYIPRVFHSLIPPSLLWTFFCGVSMTAIFLFTSVLDKWHTSATPCAISFTSLLPDTVYSFCPYSLHAILRCFVVNFLVYDHCRQDATRNLLDISIFWFSKCTPSSFYSLLKLKEISNDFWH